jgi:acyl-CoA synthetase (AMP-forming)/AMP-acid ligase II
MVNNALAAARLLQARPGDSWVNPMPLFHTAGCGCHALGRDRITRLPSPAAGVRPALQLELIETYRGHMLGGVPTMLMALLDHPDLRARDLSSVRLIRSGGALVPPGLVRRAEETLGVPFLITYAQTEASPCITLTRVTDAPDDRACTVGRPIPNVEVRIADPATRATTPAGVGSTWHHTRPRVTGDLSMNSR